MNGQEPLYFPEWIGARSSFGIVSTYIHIAYSGGQKWKKSKKLET